MTPELSHVVRASEIGTTLRHERVAATPGQCAALMQRFDLLALDALGADLTIVRDAGGIRVTGPLSAQGTQACVVSAEPVPFALTEAVDLRFSDAAAAAA